MHVQYLNCKILHWGDAFAALSKRIRNVKVLLWKLCNSVPKLSENKIGFHQKLKSVCHRNQAKTKKIGLHRNSGLYLAVICGIYSCWQALFHLIIQRSNLYGGTLTLDANANNASPRVPRTVKVLCTLRQHAYQLAQFDGKKSNMLLTYCNRRISVTL